MKIQENISLKNYTTFNVGGNARYFCICKNIDDLHNAIEFSKNNKIEYFILAGGSNLIVSDDGYNELIIKTEFNKLEFRDLKIIVGSGYIIDKLVNIANRKGLKGLEWAGGLPGTVGGAVRGNAGAFGGEVKDCVLKVKSQKSKIKDIEIIERNKQQCEFGYRTSIFKHNKEIILEVELKMQKGDLYELIKIADDHRQYRQDKHPIEFGCAGSTFKNYPVNFATYEVKQGFSDVIKTDPFPVIPTAAIIDRAGLKGYTIGDAQISEKHPNYIINLGNAKAKDIISLIEYVIKIVKEKYNIDLEVEPQLLGFNKKYDWESN